MVSILTLISQLIEIYIWVIIISAVLSWLFAFDVVNPRNRFVYMLWDVCDRLTRPAYAFVQKIIPPIGGVDLSPLIIILGLSFLRNFMWELLG